MAKIESSPPCVKRGCPAWAGHTYFPIFFYQEEALVLGIEIHTTSNPAHQEDICDLLAGRYPKDFKWTGWHPNCMCYEVPILATPEEVNAMADAI
ncbi:MAG: hypothetical protein IJU19_04785, partial [Bacteroidales bacterium]|nr:hypothetical protein [Bacteroidales bacterium]